LAKHVRRRQYGDHQPPFKAFIRTAPLSARQRLRHHLILQTTYGYYQSVNSLPLSQCRAPDTDGDGLNDVIEGWYVTSSTLADDDADGMPDAWEAKYDFLPSENGGENVEDTDSDGLSNRDEFILAPTPAWPTPTATDGSTATMETPCPPPSTATPTPSSATPSSQRHGLLR